MDLQPVYGSDDPFMGKFDISDFMPSEEKCFRVLRELRWRKGIECPHCGSSDVVRNGTWKHRGRYRCMSCKRYFNDLTGTIFEGSKLELREWVYAMKRLLEKASMNQISKELGRKFDTIMRVRDLASDSLAKKLVTKLKGEIEIDEAYVSAGQKGTKCTHRAPRKRGLKLRGRGTYNKDKPPIVVLVERGGEAVLSVAEDLNREHILELLEEHACEDCSLYTDDFPIYATLPGYRHRKLNRYSSREYARGDVHINTAECIFSLLKSWLRVFRGVRKDKLMRPLKLFEFEFNFRKLNPIDRLSTFMGIAL